MSTTKPWAAHRGKPLPERPLAAPMVVRLTYRRLWPSRPMLHQRLPQHPRVRCLAVLQRAVQHRRNLALYLVELLHALQRQHHQAPYLAGRLHALPPHQRHQAQCLEDHRRKVPIWAWATLLTAQQSCLMKSMLPSRTWFQECNPVAAVMKHMPQKGNVN